MTPVGVSRSARVLDGIAWSHVTAPRRALGFDFGVRVMDPVLGSYLEQILVQEKHDGPPLHLYSVVDRGAGRPGRFPIYFDGDRAVTLKTPGFALSYLLWHINQNVVEHTTDLLLFHASAVERDGVAVLFPAPMESGKTTLAAGLVRAGFRYLTDEAVAIDPETLLVQPYPKALSVDPGSWEVLADLRPKVPDEVRAYLGAQWHVRPADIRPDAVAPPCAARFVIAPRYERGAATSLRRIRPAEALSVLAENSFNLARHGARGFAALGRAVQGCVGYRLTVGDLGEACRLVSDLVDEEKEREVA
jgi:hypothetical protein